MAKNYFANTLFFLTIIIQADSWKVVHPHLQSINLPPHLLSLNSRPALLIRQRWLSGRISSAWRRPAVRPERSEKKDLGCQIVSPVKCYSSNKYENYVQSRRANYALPLLQEDLLDSGINAGDGEEAVGRVWEV